MIDGFSRPPDSIISGSKPRDGFVVRRYIDNEQASDGTAAMADESKVTSRVVGWTQRPSDQTRS